MNNKIKNLSIEEKIGQMLMVGIDGNTITKRTEKLILDYKIGGVILYKKNFNNYQELINLIYKLKKLNSINKFPLLIAIDQEGGRVNRMPKEIKNLPSPNLLTKTENIEIVEKAADITGRMLYKTGVNMNFAPVFDINSNEENFGIVGDRAFGNTIEKINKYAIPTMKKYQENKIISVIKHFPGHGATKMDSHYLLPIIKKSINELEKEDMVPFAEAIKNGAEAILVGHLIIKNITGIYTASLSRNFIIKYLRRRYKYNGLIITDDLKMRAIKMIYGTVFSVEKAFKAQNDIIVFRFNQREEEKAIKNIYKLVEKNKIKQSRINRSVDRIIKIKEKYELSDEITSEGINIEQINEEINEIREEVMNK